ncbi:MAG TPA: PAS domain S-box protein [Ignavibacteriaceae bacterium]|nr:PAS domain S-box protein [Ignavibacteriaceae bacterium]
MSKSKNIVELNKENFFSNNSLPMIIYDIDSLKILEVNTSAVKSYGYTAEEFLELTVKDLHPVEDISIIEDHLKKSTQMPERSGIWRHIKKDRTIIFVNAYSRLISLDDTKEARLITLVDVTESRKNEDAITRSERRFRELADLLPQIVFEMDYNGNLLFCNKIGFETFGIPYDKDINKVNIFSFVSPANHEIARKNLSIALTGETPDEIEYLLLRKNGSTFPSEIYSTPVKEKEKVIGLRGIIIDLSKLKLSIEELKDSEKKYSSLFENTKSVMLILDPETGNIKQVNKAASAFYGYSIAELQSMTITDLNMLTPEESMTRIEKIKNQNQYSFISKHRVADATFRFVEIFSSQIVINHRQFLFSIIHDINDRIQAESNLRKLNKAIEQSPVSIEITDKEGRLEYVNPKFTEVTGYSFEEVIGKNPNVLNSGEHSDSFYKELWETILSGKQWRGEFYNKKKNGDYFWEYASISPIFDENKQITNFVGIKEEITERKQKEKELLDAKEAAEESNRLKSSFLTNMSHELRTPLVGILGYAEILSNEINNRIHKDMANTILISGQRLIDTLNSILDLSRIEADKTELQFETVDLNDILKESAKLFKPVAEKKNLYLELILPTESPHIFGDKQIVFKIFNNLINNAIKFTFKGGITINSYMSPGDSEKVIRVKIIDTGIGIPEEAHEKVFEPFRQASEGLSRHYEGTGLGLTVTKKFVELMNGSISLQSRVGLGSTFTVTFPESVHRRKLTPNIREAVTSKTKSIELSFKPNILLVEDDKVNADIICAYLNPFTDIEHVMDGSDAIKIAKSKQYDAILMDINLKGINGIEAMSSIKELNDHYKNIPMIAITAYAMLGDREKFLSIGFSHYVSKPFTRDQLLDLLDNIFKK